MIDTWFKGKEINLVDSIVFSPPSAVGQRSRSGNVCKDIGIWPSWSLLSNKITIPKRKHSGPIVVPILK